MASSTRTWFVVWGGLLPLLCVVAVVPSVRVSAHKPRPGGGVEAPAAMGAFAAGSVERLAAPSLQGWMHPPPAAPHGGGSQDYPLYAVAQHHNARIFASRGRDPWGRGLARRGSWIRARATRSRRGCRRGRWYEVVGKGFVCTSRGFRVLEEPPDEPARPTLPDTDRALPYRYAQVITDGAPRFSRLPTRPELRAAVAHPEHEEAPVLDRMKGDYFLAIAEQVETSFGDFYRTVRGHYVHGRDLEVPERSKMHGVRLGEQARLPVAFVYGEGPSRLYHLQGRKLRQTGVAARHARLAGTRRVRRGDDDAYWVDRDGRALPEVRVRVARRIRPPRGVPKGRRWIHVDLSEQTLVAYEGRRPVFATLVSSGKEGHDTPTGLYEVRHKYVSITMRGQDPVDGPYEVEEVPWTQYYDGSYALHGAYWHDDFGRVKSHGCTNLAPADARWLYYWSAPDVPAGWHGARERGTYVYLTR